MNNGSNSNSGTPNPTNMIAGPNGQGSINAGPRGQMKHMVDPFGKVNPKARKLIESMERNRQHNN
jgi:hypothetical protein